MFRILQTTQEHSSKLTSIRQFHLNQVQHHRHNRKCTQGHATSVLMQTLNNYWKMSTVFHSHTVSK